MNDFASSGCLSTRDLPTSAGCPDGDSLEVYISVGDRQSPSVSLSGDIHGEDIGRFYDAIAQVAAQVGDQVVLDLSAVTSWTVLAQVGVLHAARELAARHCQLVLVGASRDLRGQGEGLDVVNRVQLLAVGREPSWGSG